MRVECRARKDRAVIACHAVDRPYGGGLSITDVTGKPGASGRLVLAQGGVVRFRIGSSGHVQVVHDAIAVARVRVAGHACSVEFNPVAERERR